MTDTLSDSSSVAIHSSGRILIGKGTTHQWLNLKYANRHGLIAGATGTGKTVTLQILAEGFSHAGVPVFMADIKGDLSGMACAGNPHPKIDERVTKINIKEFELGAYPITFWDIFGQQGHPIRTTISAMGPILIAQLLNLTEAQEGILHIIFALAEDQKMPLIDIKDLRALLNHVYDHDANLREYGHISKTSIGAIQRKLLQFESDGADILFSEPALDISELMRCHSDGKGIINMLAADQLMQSPKTYTSFLLWLLTELFNTLPEVGDPDKPKLVFFFDEAHLLFDNAPKILLDKIEQVVRLIRSKGVGVYFITQNPVDIPVDVLGQLGNRVQHALRAFTPKDQKAVKSAAQTFRANDDFDITEIITQLGVGEALVSVLEDKGIPSLTERALIRPPTSRMGPISSDERGQIMATSKMSGLYDKAYERVSAYEILKERNASEAQNEAEQSSKEQAQNQKSSSSSMMGKIIQGIIRSLTGTIGRTIAREIVKLFIKRLRK